MKKSVLNFVSLLLAGVVLLTGCSKNKKAAESAVNSQNTAASVTVSSAESKPAGTPESTPQSTEESKPASVPESTLQSTEESKPASVPESTPQSTGESKPTSVPESTPSETTQYYFRSKKLLDQHYEKHGRDMGFASAQEYEKAASDVVNNPAALHKTEKEDGDFVYYVESTNEFVVLSTDGYLRTYFLPDRGIDYYNKQ